jgi:type I restriction enzyme S subunit
MNADRLLEHYERIADAPDAIPRLRRFILDLAMRGKLVPQDAKDEPASELLKRIASEKVSQGDLPEGWRRATVGALLDFQYGKGLKASVRAAEGPVPVFGSNGIVGFTDEPLAVRPSIIVGRKGSAGALNLCNGPSWTTDVAYFVETPPFIEIRFLLNTLTALDLDKLGKGVKPGLSRSDAYEQLICVPPLSEQHRIAALCDRLEAARAEREAVRDRLAAASLARLNAPDSDPAAFADHARFTLDNLAALTTRPDQVKQLRETILNLAVRGKLVLQDPNDEPASELLKRIADEKARLVKAGEIRKEKPLPPIQEDATPFELPFGWVWARLGLLSMLVTSGSRDWAEYYAEEGAIFVRMGNLSRGSYNLRLNSIQRVKPPRDTEGARTRLEAGDVLISITGEVGLLGLIPQDFGEAYINQHTCVVRLMVELQSRFVPELFRSPFAQDQFNAPQRGIKNSFRLTDVTEFLVPLPPLAEQHRIVAKVDALMVLCDRLEASLVHAAASRRRLLDALLADALAPAATRKREAAE